VGERERKKKRGCLFGCQCQLNASNVKPNEKKEWRTKRGRRHTVGLDEKMDREESKREFQVEPK